MMTIAVGDDLPITSFRRMGPDGPEAVDHDALFKGRSVALFSVPGAFTPTCSARHLPGFVEKAAEIRKNGVDEIMCTAVNDVFVMDAWGKAHGADGKVSMLADGNGDFVRAIGLDIDRTSLGMGLRGQRFSMLVRDGRIVLLNVEAPGEYRVSAAGHLIGQLQTL
jgi:peroxiredoxin